MKRSLYLSLSIALMLPVISEQGHANTDDDAYYAEMERMAAQADVLQPQAQDINIEAGLGEVRKLSPSAYVTYQRLSPAYQEEVRKSIRRGKDPYQVIELIFSRNQLMSSH